ncbi:MAG: hypothetical protein FD147_541 [Chloroflexi bacterium]|nr:MAG: hypothetical protein FD147_541 [Chloroflexota bacterium]
MPEFKYILLIFGIVLLLVILTRKAIKKQKKEFENPVKPVQKTVIERSPKLTEEQFDKSWKNLSYLLLVAGAGNLFMVYNAIKIALETRSYVLWIDSAFSFAAAIVAVFIWRLHNRKSVYIYLALIVLPVMFFMSTGHYQDAMIRLFPLVLLYFVVKPVWDSME